MIEVEKHFINMNSQDPDFYHLKIIRNKGNKDYSEKSVRINQELNNTEIANRLRDLAEMLEGNTVKEEIHRIKKKLVKKAWSIERSTLQKIKWEDKEFFEELKEIKL